MEERPSDVDILSNSLREAEKELREAQAKVNRLKAAIAALTAAQPGIHKPLDLTGLRIIDAVVEFLKVNGPSCTLDELYAGLKKSHAQLSKENEGDEKIERSNLKKTVSMNAKSKKERKYRLSWDEHDEVVTLTFIRR